MVKKLITIEKASGKNHWVITTSRTKHRGEKYAEYLGEIYMEPRWKKLVFQSDQDSYWSAECLQTVLDFMQEHSAKSVMPRSSERV